MLIWVSVSFLKVNDPSLVNTAGIAWPKYERRPYNRKKGEAWVESKNLPKPHPSFCCMAFFLWSYFGQAICPLCSLMKGHSLLESSQTLKCYQHDPGSLLWAPLSGHDWQTFLTQWSTHQNRHRLCVRKWVISNRLKSWRVKVAWGSNKWQLKTLSLLHKMHG